MRIKTWQGASRTSEYRKGMDYPMSAPLVADCGSSPAWWMLLALDAK